MAEEEAVEEAAAELEEADPEGAVPIKTGEAHVTLTYPHLNPVTSIGVLERGRGIVLTDTPVHGETTKVRSQDTIETLQQLKLKQ